MTALAAAAGALTKEMASVAIKDTYQGLKNAILRRFGGDESATRALADHAQRPAVYEKPLEVALTEAGADKDEEIVRRANDLMKLLKDEGLVGGNASVVGSGAAATSGGAAASHGGTAVAGDYVTGNKTTGKDPKRGD